MLVPIVEGFAEVESVPYLIRRLHPAQGVARAFRVKRNQVVQAGQLERAITQAVRSRQGASAILVLLDADDDAACELGPALLERARATTHLPVAVVLAVREFEAWFLAGFEALRGQSGIPEDAVFGGDPERPRGAKGKLESFMDRPYLDIDDQVGFVARLDLDLTRENSPSFDKFARDLERLFAA